MKYIVKGIVPNELREELQIVLRLPVEFPTFGTCLPENVHKHPAVRTPYFETLDMAIRAWAYAITSSMIDARIYEVAEDGTETPLPTYAEALRDRQMLCDEVYAAEQAARFAGAPTHHEEEDRQLTLAEQIRALHMELKKHRFGKHDGPF